MQTAIFPMKTLRFSAIWNTSKAHKKCSGAGYKKTNYKDYPTDLVGSDTGRDWFYAPCDLVCLRVYGKASHCLWFRSVDKVDTPKGEGYLYFMVEHMSVSGFYKGKKIIKGSRMFREGRAGNATGNHLHISCGFAESKKSVVFGTGWKKNNHGAWVLYIKGVTNIKINKAFYLDKSFTKVKDERMDFVTAPKPFKKGHTYVLKATMNVRKGAGTNYKIKGKLKKGKKITALSVKKVGSAYWIEYKKDRWFCAKGSNGTIYAKSA